MNESNNMSPFRIKDLDRICWSGAVKNEKKISNAKICRSNSQNLNFYNQDKINKINNLISYDNRIIYENEEIISYL
jgi:hypothetical protein